MLEKHEHKHAVHEFDGIIENRVTNPPSYFNILFYGLVIWGIVFCGYYLFSGWSSGLEFQEKMEAHTDKYQKVTASKPAVATAAVAQTKKPSPEAASGDGQALYAANCAGCHGADGKGGFGPDLSGVYEYGKTPSAIKASIAEGREGRMPAFGSKLSSAEVDALVDYLLSL